MAASRRNLKSYDDYDDIRSTRLSKNERLAQDKAIKAEAETIRSMQESVSVAIVQFMAKEGIGINELTRRSKRVLDRLLES